MTATPRRAITLACLAGLAAAGGGMYTATRVWSQTEQRRTPPLPPETVTETGSQLAAWSVPAAFVAFAGVIAFVATGGIARRIVAVCVALAAVALAGAGVWGMSVTPGVWPLATAVLGAVVLGVAVWMMRDGASWPRMSQRYERAGDQRPIADDPAAMWDALDRGEDPTSLNIGQTAPGEECAR